MFNPLSNETEFDYIIIDCGLKHELLTVNALAAADYCIIPVQAHFLASEGIPDVLELVKNVQSRFNSKLEVAGILLTMYQSRPQLCQSVRAAVAEDCFDAGQGKAAVSQDKRLVFPFDPAIFHFYPLQIFFPDFLGMGIGRFGTPFSA